MGIGFGSSVGDFGCPVTVFVLCGYGDEVSPPDVIDFFGSGMVTYVVTYDYDLQPACGADLDGNGIVDGGDLGLLLGCWGGRGNGCDLDGDGVINGADLGLLLTAWGPCG